MNCLPSCPEAKIRISNFICWMFMTSALLCFHSISATDAYAVVYTYDALGRVVTAQYVNGSKIQYAYDSAGNRILVSINSSSESNGPVTVQDALIMNENQSTITLNPLTNDSHSGGNSISLHSVSSGVFGTATLLNGGPVVQYVSSHKRSQVERLVYVITDTAGGSSSGEIAITLQNLSPTTVNDTLTLQKNTSKSFDPRANDTDPGGDPFTIIGVSTPANGTATVSASGNSISYTPPWGFYGANTITYTVRDVDGGVATGAVAITVRHGVNPPVANNDAITASVATAKTFDPRVNDTDPDGSPISILSATNGSHGTVTVNNGVSVTYVGQAGWSGNDVITYTISDVDGQTSTASVAVTIPSGNLPPTANPDNMGWYALWSIGTPPFKPSISIDPRWNDTDPESNNLTVTGKTNGAHGTVTLSNNVLTWQKNTNVTGVTTLSDTFTYTISDGNGGTSTGTVNVNVTVEFDDPNP